MIPLKLCKNKGFSPLFGKTLFCAKYLELSTLITLFCLEEDAIERLRLTQNELNKQGASDLVVELFISQSSINILEESIHLAIALLEGGNTEVQVG
jgi:hypothetical protein